MTQLPTMPKSPGGKILSCKGWPQEAALRLLLNSVDPEVAERPSEPALPGNGVAIPGPESFQSLVAALRDLADDETLFVRPPETSAAYRTGASYAPSVLLVPSDDSSATAPSIPSGNLQRFSQISAANWFYVGPQGALQATYEILGAAARRNFAGTLGGKLVVSCGMGAVGGGQPLAATLHGAAALGIEHDSTRIKQRVKTGYCEIMVNDLDEALRILKNSVRRREPASVALIGHRENVIPELADRGVVPDLLFPNFLERASLAPSSASLETSAISELQRLGAIILDGETFAPQANLAPTITFDYEPLTCIALSGSPAEIARADRLLLELFPANEPLQRWLPLAKRHVRFQGLPARVVWLGAAERLQFALALNDLFTRGEFQAPIVLALAESNSGRTPISPAAEVTEPSTSIDARPEFLVKLASGQVAGAFLAGIGLAGTPAAPDVYPRARAVIADGTAATTERIERALGGQQRRGGDSDGG